MKRREFLRATASAVTLAPFGGSLAYGLAGVVNNIPGLIMSYPSHPMPVGYVVSPRGMILEISGAQSIDALRRRLNDLQGESEELALKMMRIAPMPPRILEELRSRLGIDTFES